MKKFISIWLLVLLYHCTNGYFRQQVSNVLPVPLCMTLTQLLRATDILCHEQRQNKTMWDRVIECHRPISDEFMRASGKTLCPNPKHVQDTTDKKYSIQDVFLNICGLVDGNPFQIFSAATCITIGTGTIASHYNEVKEVNRRWGQDLTCNIGKCVKGLGLNLGF